MFSVPLDSDVSGSRFIAGGEPGSSDGGGAGGTVQDVAEAAVEKGRWWDFLAGRMGFSFWGRGPCSWALGFSRRGVERGGSGVG